jgi:hypothetical protein
MRLRHTLLIATAILIVGSFVEAQSTIVPPLRIYDETTLLPLRYKLKMTGSSVTCTDDAAHNQSVCTFTGGGGGGGGTFATTYSSTPSDNRVTVTNAGGAVDFKSSSVGQGVLLQADTSAGDNLFSVYDNSASNLYGNATDSSSHSGTHIGTVTALTASRPYVVIENGASGGSPHQWYFYTDSSNVRTIEQQTGTDAQIVAKGSLFLADQLSSTSDITLDGDITLSANGDTTISSGGEVFINAVDMTQTVDSVGAAVQSGYILQNTTAAALGAQQFSPSVHLAGSGWGTGGSAAEPVSSDLLLCPVQGSDAAADMCLYQQNGGGGATESFRVAYGITNSTDGSPMTVIGQASGTGAAISFSSNSGGQMCLWSSIAAARADAFPLFCVNVNSLTPYTLGTIGSSSRPFTTAYVGATGALPTCDSTTRGGFRTVFAASLSADTYQVCMKNTSDVYSWQTVFTAL